MNVWLRFGRNGVEESSAAFKDNVMDQLIILPGLYEWVSNSLTFSVAPYTM